jgi:hypothetical protein
MMRILLPQAKPLQNRSVTGLVGLFKIIKEFLPLRNKLQKAPPRMMVLGVHLEVLGQISDPFTEQRYLHIRRTRIGLMYPVGLDNLFLFKRVEHLLTTFPVKLSSLGTENKNRP